MPFRDPGAIAREVLDLLDHEDKRHALCARAAAYGEGMRWPQVARAYLHAFEQARLEHASRAGMALRRSTLAERPLPLPELNLEHLGALTDSTGILHTPAFTIPRYEDGYCLDDNARALLLTTLLRDADTGDVQGVEALAARYLAFVAHAFNARARTFRNFMSYHCRFLEERGSEDGHGRAIRALGTVVGHASAGGLRSRADSLFRDALAPVVEFSSPRAWAYALLGIAEYLRTFQDEGEVESIGRQLARKLLSLFQRTSRPGWPWFEDRANYCNARLSQALLVSGAWIRQVSMKAAGLESLDWLLSVQTSHDGFFAPIGSNGFHVRGGDKAASTSSPSRSIRWSRPVWSPSASRGRAAGSPRRTAPSPGSWEETSSGSRCTTRVRAGVATACTRIAPNENQGAESTLSFLLALVEMRSI